MSEFIECSRGEFFRRAKSVFPLLGKDALIKAIQRGHISVKKPEGGYCVFDKQSWHDLENYVKLRSRLYLKENDVVGREVFDKGLNK